MIQQELSLVPELAVDENIFLGQEKVRSFFIVDRERQVRAAGEVLRPLDFHGRIDQPIAKLRVGEAAGTGAAIAHQVHGAMGFTYEHSLHHATRRLWAWREEFGNETHWATQLGHMVAERGADELWPFITQGS